MSFKAESGLLTVNTVPLRTFAVRYAVSFGVVAALFLYASLFKATYVDDAFIQLQYARDLIVHHTWGFFPDRVVNTATSPLNVILTALVGLVVGSLIDVVVWLTTLELALLLLLLLRISGHLFGNYYFGIFCFLAFATNPLLLSTLGLEGLLYTLLVIAAVAVSLSRTWWLLAVVLGLLTLARSDGGLLFVIFLLLLPVSLKGRAKFMSWCCFPGISIRGSIWGRSSPTRC
ncbi:MAG: hypothetical protein M3Q65_00010 [Chloroflexota bacterium]|nr:hypothetical protein [Chloroflexota bacterium]